MYIRYHVKYPLLFVMACQDKSSGAVLYPMLRTHMFDVILTVHRL